MCDLTHGTQGTFARVRILSGILVVLWLGVLSGLLFALPQQVNAQKDATSQEGGEPPIDDPLWLRQQLEAIRVEYRLPALSASVVVDTRVVAASTVGFRKNGDPTPATRDDAFTIGSISKPMSALLIARLVEQGTVSFDDTLEEMYPELKDRMKPAYRKVTVRQLLSHTSGLPYTASKQETMTPFGKGDPATALVVDHYCSDG